MGRYDSGDGILAGEHMGYHRPNGSGTVLRQYLWGLTYVDEALQEIGIASPELPQGPLDRRFAEPDGGLHTEGGSRVMGQGGLRLRISRLCGRRRSRQKSRFEAVLGKTHRTEF